MTDFLWSGYKAAIDQTYLTNTQLASLTDGQISALGGEIDNTSTKYQFADFQLDLASINVTSTAAYCVLFVVPTVDGTNYPDWASATYGNFEAQYAVGSFLLKVQNAAHRAALSGVVVPPGKFKIALRNASGVTFANSAQTVGIRFYDTAY